MIQEINCFVHVEWTHTHASTHTLTLAHTNQSINLQRKMVDDFCYTCTKHCRNISVTINSLHAIQPAEHTVRGQQQSTNLSITSAQHERTHEVLLGHFLQSVQLVLVRGFGVTRQHIRTPRVAHRGLNLISCGTHHLICKFPENQSWLLARKDVRFAIQTVL